MDNDFKYTLKVIGFMREEDYPYTGSDGGIFKFAKNKIVASMSNFSVVFLDDDQIATNLLSHIGYFN